MRNIFLLSFCLFIFGCGTDATDRGDRQVYNLQLIDFVNDVPLEGVEVKLSWDIGCTHSIDNVTGITDDMGRVSLTTNVDLDSVTRLLEEDEFLAEHHINQSIFIEKEGYSFYELEQDTALRWYRPYLNEKEEVIVKMHENVPVKIITQDEDEDRDELLIVEYHVKQSHPDLIFEDLVTANVFFQVDQEHVKETPLFLAKQVEYHIDYFVARHDSINDMLDTLIKSSLNLPVFSDLDEKVFEVKI